LSETIPVIDVRSPSEYSRGHMPVASNVPVFDDTQRESVGIEYKREGRSKAIIKGLKLAGPGMHEKLREALEIAEAGKILVHCWRGGMRSEAMGWLLSLAGIDIYLLEGGYKAYRNHVLGSLGEKRQMIILGGMTGSGKTRMLQHIGRSGRQVIDLEAIASHKGSAFGALGQAPQPTSEHFANLLYDQWKRVEMDQPVWLEDESRNIGTVFMPDAFYNNMQKAPTIILLIDRDRRIPRLIEEYAVYPRELLAEAVMKIRKRLGGDRASDALRAIETGDLPKAIEITLEYYDKAYLHGITRKRSGNIIQVKTDTDDIMENSRKIIDASRQINL
jgi:tRNA 2-selenouridine synthase